MSTLNEKICSCRYCMSQDLMLKHHHDRTGLDSNFCVWIKKINRALPFALASICSVEQICAVNSLDTLGYSDEEDEYFSTSAHALKGVDGYGLVRVYTRHDWK